MLNDWSDMMECTMMFLALFSIGIDWLIEWFYSIYQYHIHIPINCCIKLNYSTCTTECIKKVIWHKSNNDKVMYKIGLYQD